MASSNVFHLFCQAVTNGSVTQLSEIRKSDSGKTVPLSFLVNHRNLEGDTLLEIAIKREHFDVAEFIVKELKRQIYPEWQKKHLESACSFSWSKLNFNEILEPTTLLPSAEAVNIRDLCGQIPMIKLIEYLIEYDKDELLWLEFVLDSMIASSISRQEKILVFELMGVLIICNQSPSINLSMRRRLYEKKNILRGLHSWKQAMVLRCFSADGYPVIPKIPCNILQDISRVAFGDTFEFMTTEDLEKLEIQFWQHRAETRTTEEFYHLNEPIVTQALLVSQRIYSQSNTGPNPFYLRALEHYGLETGWYAVNDQNDREFNIYQLILEQSSGFNSTFSPNCIQSFAHTLSWMSDSLLLRQQSFNYDNWPDRYRLSPDKILLFLKLSIKVLTNLLIVPPITCLSQYWQLNIMEQVVRCIFVFNEPDERSNQQDSAELEAILMKTLSPYLHLNNSNSYTSLFHLAVERRNKCHASERSRLTTIKQFLEYGADPTVIDMNGKTALHIFAEKSEWDNSSVLSLIHI